MGLQKNDGDGSGAVYLNVSDGRLVRTHRGAVDGVTESRVNKNGKTVHEEKYNVLTGYLKNARIQENEFGKQWQFLVQDAMDRFVVCMQYSSRYATSLLKALPNVDLSKEVAIKPYSFIDKDDPSKKIIGITLYQDNKKIEPAFTKENPNGLPAMKQVRVKGADVWDTEEMDNFLAARCAEKFAADPVADDIPDFLK